MPSAKNTKAKACPPCAKDGYGAHWHSVGWIAAVAVVLSTSAMTLSASAAGSPAVTPNTLYRAINEVKSQVIKANEKLDRIEAKLGSNEALPSKSTTTNP